MRDNYKYFELMDQNGVINRDNRADSGENGMVATARHEASKIGIDIIKKGGNAIDAAVAVGFALGVCEPNASGLGGGGFMTIHSETGDVRFIDFRETAPDRATPSMWPVADNGEIIGNAKSQGGLSVCIPGEVAGMVYALEKYGSMSLKEVIRPAINMAEDGFVVTSGFKKDLLDYRDKLLQYEERGNPFLRDYQIGDLLVNKPLSNILKDIAEEGVDGFYKGTTAQRIVSSINANNGYVDMEELSTYQAREMAPIKGTYRGYEIISSPLPSSGGTHIIQILNILENFDMGSYGVNSTEYLHVFSEAFKMSFADRQKYMGDPKFAKIPIQGLVSKDYAKELAAKIIMDQAKSFGYDDPFEYEPKDTTHYSIADHAGNMVSVTKTISAFFGSGVVPEDTGFVLNCQMRGFAQGSGKANSVGPGKKPLSSMSPTIILKEGKPFAVLGSPGGNRIITTLAQVISKLIDYQMSIQDAINSPRISNDVNSMMFYENRICKNVINELVFKSHEVTELADYDRKFGGLQGIRYNEDGSITGAADPRRDGIAIGY
jgi:gamma-glutamyltranspeptidase/glutathione hydrolase